MTLTRPWATDAAFPNASDQRKQLASIYPREGVFPDPTTIAAPGIAYAGSGWGVNARAFTAVAKRGGAPYSQSYGSALIGNDGVVTGAWTIAGAPGTGSRIDLLCVRARDTTQGDSATGTPMDGPGGVNRSGIPEFLTVTGVASGSPVAPGLPAGYQEVARALTPSSAVSIAGSTITNTYAFAHAVGGTIFVRTIAERNALTNVLPGDRCVVLSLDGAVFTRVGSSWAAISRSGLIIPTNVANGTITGSGIVTFAAVSSVILEGVFSSLFNEYEIGWDITSKSAGGFDSLRMAAAGVPANAAGSYVWRRSGSTGAGYSETASTSPEFSVALSGLAKSRKRLRVTDPAVAAFTNVIAASGMETDDSSYNTFLALAGQHRVATAYDGCQLAMGAGTMTGSIWVRGIA